MAMIGFVSLTRADVSFGFKPDGTLDETFIRKKYFEGDFRRIQAPLEAWRTSLAKKTREDSIFIYKYLGVIYAADSATRNKGESYLVQMLKLRPTMELADMYLSEKLEAMFKGVQEKYLKEQEYLRHHDEHGRLLADSTAGQGKPKQDSVKGHPARSSQRIRWAVGGVGLASVAVGSYYLFQGKASSSSKSTIFNP